MITDLLYKPDRRQPLVNTRRLAVSPSGVNGAVAATQMRQILIVPQSTLQEFQLQPGDLRENVVIDDSSIGGLHALPSGTVLQLGAVRVRLTIHCEPCGRLKELVPSIKMLEHKRGYLGTILNTGTLQVGQAVTTLGHQFESIPDDLKERARWYIAKLEAPVRVTQFVEDIGLSLFYCRAVPQLIKDIPNARDLILFGTTAKHTAEPANRLPF